MFVCLRGLEIKDSVPFVLYNYFNRGLGLSRLNLFLRSALYFLLCAEIKRLQSEVCAADFTFCIRLIDAFFKQKRADGLSGSKLEALQITSVDESFHYEAES